jgi:hypothetical protein
MVLIACKGLYRQQSAKERTASWPLSHGFSCCQRIDFIGAEAVIFVSFVSFILLLLPCFVYECKNLLQGKTAAPSTVLILCIDEGSTVAQGTGTLSSYYSTLAAHNLATQKTGHAANPPMHSMACWL